MEIRLPTFQVHGEEEETKTCTVMELCYDDDNSVFGTDRFTCLLCKEIMLRLEY